MAEPVETRPPEYRRLFPWLHLARAFRMAVDPRKLLLAGLALVAINGLDALWNEVRYDDEVVETDSTGSRIRGYFGLAEELARADVPAVVVVERRTLAERIDDRGYLIDARFWPWDWMEEGVELAEARLATGWVQPAEILGHVWDVSWAIGGALLIEPVMSIARPFVLLFQPVASVDKAYLVVRLFWALVVWALVGGAITRIAALEFARDERLGTIAAIRYAGGRFFSFLFAPLIAVICVAVIVLFCFLGGLIGSIPYVGPLFAGVLWFLPLLAGFVIALVVVGAVLGWPLMYATISTQDSDAFDGFSRSYTFVYGRPWYVALLAFLTLLFAVVGFGVVYVFTVGTDLASQYAVATGMGIANVKDLVGRERVETPAEVEERVDSARPAEERVPLPVVEERRNTGTWAGVFWRRFVLLLAAGFGASFFWVASTVSYFLLRRADDGTSLDEVEVAYDAGDDPLAPLAGVAPAEPTAARPAPVDRPVGERPIVELSTAEPGLHEPRPGVDPHPEGPRHEPPPPGGPVGP